MNEDISWLEPLPEYWHVPGDLIPSHDGKYHWHCISYPFCRIYWDWEEFSKQKKKSNLFTRWLTSGRWIATPDKIESDWYDPKWYGNRGKWQRHRGWNYLSYEVQYELPWKTVVKTITPRWDTSEFASGKLVKELQNAS